MKIRFNNARRSMFKPLVCITFFLLLCTGKVQAQFYSVQTNALEWATGTLNIEGSLALSKNWTLNASIACNPWTLKDNKKIKHWLVEPGARYWLWQSYVGHFIGFHAIGTRYNMGWKKNRYDGHGFGAGISYGRAWLLGRRWNIEAEAGIGAIIAKQTKYDCGTCGDYLSMGTYLLPVPRLSINFVYLF